MQGSGGAGRQQARGRARRTSRVELGGVQGAELSRVGSSHSIRRTNDEMTFVLHGQSHRFSALCFFALGWSCVAAADEAAVVGVEWVVSGWLCVHLFMSLLSPCPCLLFLLRCCRLFLSSCRLSPSFRLPSPALPALAVSLPPVSFGSRAEQQSSRDEGRKRKKGRERDNAEKAATLPCSVGCTPTQPSRQPVGPASPVCRLPPPLQRSAASTETIAASQPASRRLVSRWDERAWLTRACIDVLRCPTSARGLGDQCWARWPGLADRLVSPLSSALLPSMTSQPVHWAARSAERPLTIIRDIYTLRCTALCFAFSHFAHQPEIDC